MLLRCMSCRLGIADLLFVRNSSGVGATDPIPEPDRTARLRATTLCPVRQCACAWTASPTEPPDRGVLVVPRHRCGQCEGPTFVVDASRSPRRTARASAPSLARASAKQPMRFSDCRSIAEAGARISVFRCQCSLDGRSRRLGARHSLFTTAFSGASRVRAWRCRYLLTPFGRRDSQSRWKVALRAWRPVHPMHSSA